MFRSLVYQLGYICDFVNVSFTSSMSMALFSKNIPNIFFSYLLTDFFLILDANAFLHLLIFYPYEYHPENYST